MRSQGCQRRASFIVSVRCTAASCDCSRSATEFIQKMLKNLRVDTSARDHVSLHCTDVDERKLGSLDDPFHRLVMGYLASCLPCLNEPVLREVEFMPSEHASVDALQVETSHVSQVRPTKTR